MKMNYVFWQQTAAQMVNKESTANIILRHQQSILAGYTLLQVLHSCANLNKAIGLRNTTKQEKKSCSLQ